MPPEGCSPLRNAWVQDPSEASPASHPSFRLYLSHRPHPAALSLTSCPPGLKGGSPAQEGPMWLPSFQGAPRGGLWWSSPTGRRRQEGRRGRQQPGACGGWAGSPRAEGGLWREGPPRAHLPAHRAEGRAGTDSRGKFIRFVQSLGITCNHVAFLPKPCPRVPGGRVGA